MKKILSKITMGIAVLLALSFALSIPAGALSNPVTIIGEITEEFQIIAEDGTVYEVGDTPEGDDLLTHIGLVAEVIGTVQEDKEGVKVMYVASFKILSD